MDMALAVGRASLPETPCRSSHHPYAGVSNPNSLIAPLGYPSRMDRAGSRSRYYVVYQVAGSEAVLPVGGYHTREVAEAEVAELGTRFRSLCWLGVVEAAGGKDAVTKGRHLRAKRPR
jgi:hypothetical protein